jgi:threonine dehydrogenase-like Zn-dependent dehydrogenase
VRAAVYKEKGVFAVEEVATPSPAVGELLIRIKYCGICGTDLHNYSFGITSPGSVIGHEWCGVIEELGDGVGDFKVGDRVMLYAHPSSLSVNKRLNTGSHRKDPRAYYSAPGKRGAFAEYITAPPSQVIRIPDGVTDESAACLEPLVAAIHAVRLGNLQASDTVAFIGAGPIALFMIQRVKQGGARGVYVSEISPTRAAKAKELGADKVFNPLEDDIISEIVALTGGIGPDIVYECAAGENTLNQACQLVALNGRVTCLAVYQGPITLEPLDWYMRQPEIKFTTNGDSTPFDWEIAAETLRERTIDVESTITDIIPLDDIQDTFQALLKPATNNMLRVLVKP